MRPIVPMLALTVAVPLAAQQHAPSPLDSMAIRAHTYFLAHDLLEGRGTGTRGIELAAEYLAASATRLGLQPLPGAQGFQLPVPLVSATIDSAGTTMIITDSSGTSTWPFRRAFIPNVGNAQTLRGFSGGVAWVGRAADILANPGRLPDLHGRVAVMSGAFGADGAAADTLLARGVTGVIQFVGSAETYRLYVQSRGEARLYVADSTVRSSFIPPIPTVIADVGVIRRLLPGVTGDAQLERPFLVSGVRVEVRVATRARPLPARNVAAMIPGTDPALRGEYVAFTAHYDHLGIEQPDVNGDSIYNGFSDNAAGSAMLLAIAQYFAQHRTPRSLLFLWFTGEERGLLGSDYFVAHSPVPLDRINGVINLDAGAPPAAARVWRISGAERSGLGQIAIDVAAAQGWEGQAAPASPNTDYFPFLRSGVPAVFLVPAPAPYEGLTTDSSQALRRRWDHYHQAADNWAADFPFGGLVRYAELARLIGERIARGPRIPAAR